MATFGSRINRLELRHLQAAVALADHGGFGRAARALGVAQPLFSTLIQRLEAAAGEALFERRPGVRLTRAGESLLPHLRAALGEAGRGFEGVARIRRGEAGILSIGLPTWLLATFVPKSIEAYRARRPDVALRLHDVSSARQLRMLKARELDVAFIRASAVEDPEIENEILFAEPFCLVTPEDHRLAGRPVGVADLHDQPYVSFPRANAPALYDQIDALFARAGARPQVAQEAQEWATILAMVRMGFGVAIAPQSLQRLWPQGLSFEPLADPDAVSRVHVCRRSDADPAAAEFLASLRAEAAFAVQATSTR